jgi:hypothetical protein
MSTINMVKFFFLKGSLPRDASSVQSLMTLAYQTARENNLFPKQILIRCVDLLLLLCSSCHAYLCSQCSGGGHSTTNIAGQYQPDPNGYHFTFCYKDEQHVQNQTHIACHGYTPGPNNYTLQMATFAPTKPDDTLKDAKHGARLARCGRSHGWA